MRRIDDIPEAIRKKNVQKKPSISISTLAIVGMSFVGLLAFFLKVFLINNSSHPQVVNIGPTPNVEVVPQSNEKIENILGHLPYREANQKDLSPVTFDGHIKLRKAAAEKFLAMQQAALSQGIVIKPISGFRSIKDQQYLFFTVKEQRDQSTSKRAEVSAPPGYSEHHTGYAVDIGDGKVPSTNLNKNFDKTAAFHWLERNANLYSFEISFPLNNVQGVSYEPWHWRFVGDQDSLETFYKAEQLKKQANP